MTIEAGPGDHALQVAVVTRRALRGSVALLVRGAVATLRAGGVADPAAVVHEALADAGADVVSILASEG